MILLSLGLNPCTLGNRGYTTEGWSLHNATGATLATAITLQHASFGSLQPCGEILLFHAVATCRCGMLPRPRYRSKPKVTHHHPPSPIETTPRIENDCKFNGVSNGSQNNGNHKDSKVLQEAVVTA